MEVVVPLVRLQQETMSDGAVRAMRDAILDGTFKPGSQLRETYIAADLGISRAPLREALHRLEEEGLVVRIPFRGAYVAEMSPRVAQEIEALRSVLEPFAVECALPHLATQEGRAELAEAVRLLGERSAAGDRSGSIDAHLAVHRSLYRASGNQVLLEIWESWESQLRLFLAVDHRSFGKLSDIAEPHDRLLTVIESGDLNAIRRELAGHIPQTVPVKHAKPRRPSTGQGKRATNRRPRKVTSSA
jgi:DNA-binding GntR family transcriptional regulator